MKRRAALILAAGLPACSLAQGGAQGGSQGGAQGGAQTGAQGGLLPLRQQARAGGRSYGAAIRSEILTTDAAYAALYAAEAEILTPEWEAKWEALQPEEGRYDYAPLNQILAFSQQNQQRLRGHALIWHQAMPPWLTAGG